MIEIIILITSAVAIWLVNDQSARARRWGAIFGLISQPFWFYIALRSAQWGVFFLCLFYTVAWFKGACPTLYKRYHILNILRRRKIVG